MPRSRAETWIQARAAHGPERASRLLDKVFEEQDLDDYLLEYPLSFNKFIARGNIF